MINEYVTCILSGDNFSPALFVRSSGLKLTNINEKGDIGKIGRFKNKKIPFGSAEIDISDIYIQNKLKNIDQFDLILVVLSDNLPKINAAGVTDIYLDINLEYEDQCNWELKREQIKKLAEIDINLSISCFKRGDN